MAQRTCSIEGCTSKHAARGWCAKHYARWKSTGTTDESVRPRKPETCVYDGCGGRANVPGAAKGYCQKHYARIWKHGDPDVTLITVGNDPVCSEDGCNRPHVAKGICAYHYALQREANTPPCAVDECELNVRARAWCQAHYHRWRNYGDVLAHIPLRGHVPDGVAWCPSCEALRPRENFLAAPSRPNGLMTYCRECQSELRRTKYRDRIRAQQARWHAANPEASRRYNRNWSTRNPEKIRAKNARQKAAKPEQYRLYARAGEANRRAREKAAPGHATSAQIVARWAYFGNRCWMCGSLASVTDHVKPLAKGGSNWPANMRPACGPCNNSKRARWPFPLEVWRAGRPARREAA